MPGIDRDRRGIDGRICVIRASSRVKRCAEREPFNGGAVELLANYNWTRMTTLRRASRYVVALVASAVWLLLCYVAVIVFGFWSHAGGTDAWALLIVAGVVTLLGLLAIAMCASKSGSTDDERL